MHVPTQRSLRRTSMSAQQVHTPTTCPGAHKPAPTGDGVRRQNAAHPPAYVSPETVLRAYAITRTHSPTNSHRVLHVERRTRTLGPTRARILSHIRPCAVCVCKPPRTPDGHADTPPRIHTPAVTRIHTQTHRSCADIRMCHVREYMCAQALPTEASINRTREHAHAHMHTHT